MVQADHHDVEAQSGFVVVRTRRNGDGPRDYLRTVEIVGRNGLAHLTYGPHAAVRVFASRREAEDIVRRLRRRAAIGAYDYLVEELVGEASTG
jgi:hypothetical protein